MRLLTVIVLVALSSIEIASAQDAQNAKEALLLVAARVMDPANEGILDGRGAIAIKDRSIAIDKHRPATSDH